MSKENRVAEEEPNFLFVIHFTGLCTFVNVATGHVRVVLPNARDHSHGMNHQPHHAAVLVHEDRWDAASRDYDLKFNGLKAHYPFKSMLAFELEDEDLEIKPSAANLSPNWKNLLNHCPTPGSGGDERSLNWMAKMKDPGAGTMKKKAFDAGVRGNVQARLDLKEGVLETELCAFDKTTRKYLKWTLKNSGGGTVGDTRALAEVISLQVKIKSDKVTISSSAGSAKNIILKPSSPTGATVEAWLVNLPWDDILADRSGATRDPDHHFAHFYAISSEGDKEYIPHPEPNTNLCTSTVPGTGVTNPKCPPVFFETHE